MYDRFPLEPRRVIVRREQAQMPPGALPCDDRDLVYRSFRYNGKVHVLLHMRNRAVQLVGLGSL